MFANRPARASDRPSDSRTPDWRRRAAPTPGQGHDRGYSLIRRAPSRTLSKPSQVPSVVRDVIHSAGRPLDAPLRDGPARRLAFDFSSVRVHTDSVAANSAEKIHAEAYSVGNHIVFNRGRFAPNTPAGMQLLNHELVHVAQQRATQPTGQLVLGAQHDPAELEAEQFARDDSMRTTQRQAMTNVVHRQTAPTQIPSTERRTLPPPDKTTWERFKSQGTMLERMFRENRYGCWCGPGNVCTEVRDDIDACCKAHDEAYARVGVSSEPKPGETGMWSADGYAKTAEIDQTLVDCSQKARERGRRVGAAALYVEGVSLIFSTRASIGRSIRTAHGLADVASGLARTGQAVGEQLFVRPILAARASVDPSNWDLSPLAARPRTDLAVVGTYLWSQLHPNEPNEFAVRIARPLNSYAIPPALLDSIARGASEASSRATGWRIELRAQDLASLNPYVLVNTLYNWKALRFRADPQAIADRELRAPSRSDVN